MNYQSEKLKRLNGSPSMAVSQAAKAMIADGLPVIDLSIGEPDFNTPDNVVEAGIRAMREGQTHYTAPAGIPALKQAVADKFKTDNGLDYNLNEVTVTSGAKQLIFNALMATLEQGDEVIILAPYFVSYPDLVRLHGGTPVIVECKADNGFRPTREQLESALSPKTRWIMINSPSNPSGAVFNREDMQMIGQAVSDYPNCLVMSDEIYEKVVFGDADFISFVAACPHLRERTLIVNGLSKSHAMTGWRVGYAAGPAELITAINKLNSQSTTNVCSISQFAGVEALTGDQAFVEQALARYQTRRDLFVEGLEQIAGLNVFSPEGAFYVFVDCSELIGAKTEDGTTLENDKAVAQYLLREGLVACVPGAAYGMEPFVRFSFATSETILEQAVKNIGQAIEKLAR